MVNGRRIEELSLHSVSRNIHIFVSYRQRFNLHRQMKLLVKLTDSHSQTQARHGSATHNTITVRTRANGSCANSKTGDSERTIAFHLLQFFIPLWLVVFLSIFHFGMTLMIRKRKKNELRWPMDTTTLWIQMFFLSVHTITIHYYVEMTLSHVECGELFTIPFPCPMTGRVWFQCRQVASSVVRTRSVTIQWRTWSVTIQWRTCCDRTASTTRNMCDLICCAKKMFAR